MLAPMPTRQKQSQSVPQVGAMSIYDASQTGIVINVGKNIFHFSGMGGSRMGPAGLTRFCPSALRLSRPVSRRQSCYCWICDRQRLKLGEAP